ncbi:hypothetical protein SAMN04490243_0746 [Robiginitalea myxolifaciens]|uniref:Uncharacterized protein n=1 Tax=Robiginitalea myxolifaciens TaxID=400055 RepID=A0A1I6FVI0_9FLAO|nr:hypothetical protein [Robiginitalea myxolifaciens]SFR33886.1 hypothetical protein SAMN04490243_0746 [Robiginitalea myxolifaciens]
MALLVLFSTMSFSVEMHYCGDHLVDFSFIQKVDTCMMKAEKAKPQSQCSMPDMDMEMDCCSDVEVVFEGQDDLKLSFDQLSFDQQIFLTSFVYSYVNLFEGFDENIVPFKDYAPPPLIRDVQVLHQTFLI